MNNHTQNWKNPVFWYTKWKVKCANENHTDMFGNYRMVPLIWYVLLYRYFYKLSSNSKHCTYSSIESGMWLFSKQQQTYTAQMKWNKCCFRARFCPVRLYTGPGISWVNEMNFVVNHAPGAGSIADLFPYIAQNSIICSTPEQSKYQNSTPSNGRTCKSSSSKISQI